MDETTLDIGNGSHGTCMRLAGDEVHVVGMHFLVAVASLFFWRCGWCFSGWPLIFSVRPMTANAYFNEIGTSLLPLS